MNRLKRDIGKRFAKLRGKRSYLKFAQDCGVSVSLLQRYETGGGLPSVDNLFILHMETGVSLDWLLLGRGSMFN